MRRRLADGARGKRSRGSGGPVLLVASAAVVAIGTVAIGTAGTAIAAPAAVSQLVRYCSGKADRLEDEFPESDLVRFLYRHGT